MQDMLDIDIRSEVATVVGGTSEFSSLINDLPSSLDLDIGSTDGELSWLGGPKWSATTDIYADVGACVNPNSVMPLITSSLLNSSKGQINLNTNNLKITNSPPQSPKESKSHLTFSPHQIKVPSIITHENKRPSPLTSITTTSSSLSSSLINRNLAENIKRDLSTDLKEDKSTKTNTLSSSTSSLSNKVISSTSTSTSSGANTIKLGHGIGGLTFSNNISHNKLKQTNSIKISGINSSGNIAVKTDKETSSLNNGNILNGLQNENNTRLHTQNLHHKIASRSILVQNKNHNITAAMNNNLNSSNNNNGNNNNSSNNNHHQHNTTLISSSNIKTSSISSKSSKPIDNEYPKPAYSYSCLIAMALKNSRSGSLPVSEIYSFMCEHFPYFKTAPNGWKNSVRHNLSLNKCFEKIEKPITNGGQRKGCLWAMNPAKVTKMDEEVQKWSRKDPMAIRKAMVYPENLEALERGEMKHGSTGDSDNEGEVEENDLQSQSSDIEENSDNEQQDHELDENPIETPPESINDDDKDDDDNDNDNDNDEDEDSNSDEDNDNNVANNNKHFNLKITEIYDLEDDKELIRRQIQCNNDNFIESGNLPTSSKKARLDVNYSISSNNIFDQQQQQQRHNFQHQHHQQQQQQQQQTMTHHNRRKMPLVNRIA